MNSGRADTGDEEPRRADRILLVDDEEVMRRLLTRAMGGAGYWCSAAGTGEEAIELLRVQEFDLAVVDKNLPDVSGIEVARRALDPGRQIPVIIVTAYPSDESKHAARSLGVARYITKPFGVHRLRKEVERLLITPRRASEPAAEAGEAPPGDRATIPPPPAPKAWVRTTGMPSRARPREPAETDVAILILEPDSRVRNALARTLADEGCRVVAFRTQDQAETHARYVGYDVLVARPEVLGEIRHWATLVPGEPPLGALAIVEGAGVAEHVKAIQAGARGLLSPPFDELAVAAELRQALSTMRNERERFSLPPGR
jgi:DNA-binding response OmpR family regulator